MKHLFKILHFFLFLFKLLSFRFKKYNHVLSNGLKIKQMLDN